MSSKLDCRLAGLLRAASPRGEPDPVEAPNDSGPGRIILSEHADPKPLSRAAQRLAADGLLAVTASPRGLSRARRLLETAGLAYRGTFLRSDRALVHASPAGRRLMAEQSVLSRPRLIAMRFAPDVVAPQVALFTRRDGPHPLAWVAPQNDAAVLVAGHQSGNVAVRIEPAGLFAKWAADSRDVERLSRANESCLAFAPGARTAGFDVPEPRLLRLGGALALVTEARPVYNAAALLRRRPGDLPSLTDRLVSTLEAWNLGSRELLPFGQTGAARQLTSDLEVLEPHLELGAVPGLIAAERTTPVGPAHGDVSMWNVLVGADSLTLVDWEASAAQMLPGFDAEYALVDAAAAATSYADRVAAFVSSDVAGLRQRIAATSGMPPAVARLAPVVCWAHHAANEIRRNGDDASFLAILRLVLADVST